MTELADAVDLAEVRQRVEETFGTDAVARAAAASQPRRRFHGRWWWPNCSAGQPSALAGGRFGLAPRLKKVLDIAVADSKPAAAAPHHLLAAILEEGKGVACQILARRGADIAALTAVSTSRLT